MNPCVFWLLFLMSCMTFGFGATAVGIGVWIVVDWLIGHYWGLS